MVARPGVTGSIDTPRASTKAVWAEMLQLGEALVSAQAYEHVRAVA
jgi:hypothetical protein